MTTKSKLEPKPEEEKAEFLKSFWELTDEELEARIDRAKRGVTTFKFARKQEDRFQPNHFGTAPMIRSDEIVGGRYSPGDGKSYDSKSAWHRSLEANDIHFIDPNKTKLPPKKMDTYTDAEYEETYQEAHRMLKWKEDTVGEAEEARNKEIREALVNKYGTEEERKPENRRKIVEGE